MWAQVCVQLKLSSGISLICVINSAELMQHVINGYKNMVVHLCEYYSVCL